MSTALAISVELLNGTFHGRTDKGPEWPPSPMRLYQALTAAAAAMEPGALLDSNAAPALRWLASLPVPTILAPRVTLGSPFRTAAPNNDLDIVAADWSRRRKPRKQPSELRTLKTVRRIHVPEGSRITYLWPAEETPNDLVGELARICRYVSRLGWGIDLARCSLELKVIDLASITNPDGEVWRPVGGHGTRELRSPRPTALEALERRHERFLSRLNGGYVSLVPPLEATAYQPVHYARDIDVPRRPVVAFELHDPGTGQFRVFDPVRDSAVLAGMLRNAAARAARRAGWSKARINVVIHGHSADGRRPAEFDGVARRFSYLPLPTIELLHRDGQSRLRLEAIRRVLVAGGPDLKDEIRWLETALTGAELVEERSGRVVALLQPVAGRDWVLNRYVGWYSTWVTTTPILMPGYDDGKPAKTERLIRRALQQAGIPPLLAERAHVTWSPAALLPGADGAWRYRRPANLDRSIPTHLRLTWLDADSRPLEIPGPLAFGSGRYRGLGVMAGD